ncbi:CHASE2 domain-containing protein [Deinococcus detaillensis]|uniref:CHASE2 domain-containing protein n=1 Tax=Deinococcus detaillensis TaxID=2592048 RepID=A0A553UZQ0_9DEIO|nr:CHASE2 domain-containing protein [Deinococcus detaillensis]TSA85682.1 CHASE2 domain-containing protein [Deinococcus detaillensis]
MPRPERRAVLAPLAALLAVGLLMGFPENVRLWSVLDRTFTRPPDPRVVVVGIDDASLRDYGRLSDWNRDLYARALGTLRQAGAKAVGFDILFGAPAAGDASLSAAVGQGGVVLASSPQLPQGARAWKALYGVASLNIEGGAVSRFQTAYQSTDGQLWPSFSAQLARLAGISRTLDTSKQLLRSLPADSGTLPVYSFRDVVGGNVAFSELQGKVVLIGLTASSVPGTTFPDSRLDPVPGVILQAGAVSSLLGEPLRSVPFWLSALICAALAASAVWLGDIWGFGLALVGVGLSVPLFLGNWLFPGTAASLSAIIGTAFVAGGRFWTLRRFKTLDPLTRLGNRLAFTRAAENRWNQRAARPLGLLLIDLGGFRRVNEMYGRAAGDEVLRRVAEVLRQGRTRRDMVFRWGASEFAVLTEPAGPDLTPLARQLQSALAGTSYKDIALRVSVGQAVSTPQMSQPSELIEQASQNRYRMKYQLEE